MAEFFETFWNLLNFREVVRRAIEVFDFWGLLLFFATIYVYGSACLYAAVKLVRLKKVGIGGVLLIQAFAGLIVGAATPFFLGLILDFLKLLGPVGQAVVMAVQLTLYSAVLYAANESQGYFRALVATLLAYLLFFGSFTTVGVLVK